MNLREERKLWRKGFKKVACLDEAGRGCLSGPVVAAAVVLRNPKFQAPNSKQIQNSKFKIQKDLKGIKDSKKLMPKKREELYEILIKHPRIEWGIGRVGNKVIDRINILEATKLAMKRAVKNLEKKLQKKRKIKKVHDRRFTQLKKVEITHDCELFKLKNCELFKLKRGSINRASLVDFLILDGNMELNLDIAQKAIVKADEKVFSCSAASILAKVVRDRAMRRYHKRWPQYGFDRHKGYATKYHRKMLEKYGPCKIHRKSFEPVKRLASLNNLR